MFLDLSVLVGMGEWLSVKRMERDNWASFQVYTQDICQRAKLHAGIKPTALCLVFDKENSIEFLLDFVYYLYMKSNPNPSFCPVLPYESLSSHVSIDKKIKKRKYKRKTIIRK